MGIEQTARHTSQQTLQHITHDKKQTVLNVKLSNEELIEKIKQGSEFTINDLHKNVERLIIKTAYGFYQKNQSLIKKTSCIDYDDILQIANIGFLKSLKNFDCNKNIKFSTYLVNTIQLTLHAEFYRNKKINNLYEKDIIKDEFDENINFKIDKDLDYNIIINDMLSILEERERNIIKDKYFVGLKPFELRNKYGLSSPAIRNIEKKSLQKIKEKMEEIK